MAKYLDDRELYRELIISKGRGILSKRATDILIILGKNTIRKMTYASLDDRNDCLQEGIYTMLLNWKNFNHLKYDAAMPYFTECFKRALAKSLTQLQGKKKYNDDIVYISIDTCNNGKASFSF